jgi:hypothetical protein
MRTRIDGGADDPPESDYDQKNGDLKAGEEVSK